MPLLDIHQMTEEDVKTHFITPAIQRKGWAGRTIAVFDDRLEGTALE